ncbi:MAG TPA: alpha/beta hydrolase [Bryobacteraceae bacterium]|nr:alpha/beta hydrolase [Bryobacteraceae bacterium]
MALHAQCKFILDQMAAAGGPPMEQMTPQELRADRAAKADAMAVLAGPLQQVARVENRTVPGPAQPIPIRTYWPRAGADLPVLVYYHGGGWVAGSLDGVDRTLRALTNASGCIVISVDYRLAPEHKFPAAVEDADASLRYVAEHAQEFGVDPNRIAVGGDSAGGTLATVACLIARDRGGPKVAFQLLIYPATDYFDDHPSMREYAQGHLLTRPAMDYFWNHYLRNREDGRHPHASPIYAESLAGLPPAFVLTAECDPIRDQGEIYAARLRASGVPVSLKRYEGAIHAFFNLGGAIDAGREAVADSAQALRAALGSQAAMSA